MAYQMHTVSNALQVPQISTYGISNHWQLDCFFNSLLRLTTEKTSKFKNTNPIRDRGWRRIHWWPVWFSQKRPVMRKTFPCHEVGLWVVGFKSFEGLQNQAIIRNAGLLMRDHSSYQSLAIWSCGYFSQTLICIYEWIIASCFSPFSNFSKSCFILRWSSHQICNFPDVFEWEKNSGTLFW